MPNDLELKFYTSSEAKDQISGVKIKTPDIGYKFAYVTAEDVAANPDMFDGPGWYTQFASHSLIAEVGMDNLPWARLASRLAQLREYNGAIPAPEQIVMQLMEICLREGCSMTVVEDCEALMASKGKIVEKRLNTVEDTRVPDLSIQFYQDPETDQIAMLNIVVEDGPHFNLSYATEGTNVKTGETYRGWLFKTSDQSESEYTRLKDVMEVIEIPVDPSDKDAIEGQRQLRSLKEIFNLCYLLDNSKELKTAIMGYMADQKKKCTSEDRGIVVL